MSEQPLQKDFPVVDFVDDTPAYFTRMGDVCITMRAHGIEPGCKSAEEDAITEEMDRIWAKLTVEEREVLGGKPPEFVLRGGPHECGNAHPDVDAFTAPAVAPHEQKVA